MEKLKELTRQLKEVTQKHLLIGNNNQFTIENMEKTKVMQNEIERLRKEIKKQTQIGKATFQNTWNTTNIGRRSKL